MFQHRNFMNRSLANRSLSHRDRSCRIFPITAFWLGFVILVCHGTGLLAQTQEKNPVPWQELHRQLQPQQGLWETVPWQISLTIACAMARESDKPLFVWAMDGHPLGCT
jgi:hypothetical protein